MWPAFENALNRHGELETLLAEPAVIADRIRYTKLAKEHGALLKMVKPYVEYNNLTAEIAQAEAMLAGADAEMRAMIEEEVVSLRHASTRCTTRLEDLLLAEGEDYGSIIMEIRAGTGGDEAALFAGDLYDMYTHYARNRGWKVEEISFSPGEQGGYKEVVFSVNGDEVFSNCATKAAAIACSACPRRKPRAASIPRRRRSPCCPSRTRCRSTSRTATSNGSACVPAGPAASTSTRPKAPSASGTKAARRKKWK